MDKYIFPAVFEPSTDGGYFITFPDLPGCITESDSLEEALFMAKDALELFIYNLESDNEVIPNPTLPENICVETHSFVVPIEAWMPLVRSQMSNKSVKKTLTIPKWLNDVAEQNDVNFSQVLQNALKSMLGISEFRHN